MLNNLTFLIMTTNTMTSATNIPETKPYQAKAEKPSLPKSTTAPAKAKSEAKEATNAKANANAKATSGAVKKEQSVKPQAKAPWWKFWSKKSVAENAKSKEYETMQKNNVADSKPDDFKTAPTQKTAKPESKPSQDRGGLNGLAPATPPAPVEKRPAPVVDPMLAMMQDLRASNAELNTTLKGISEQLRTASVRDNRVIDALQKVDQSIANADRAFAESSSAIIASNEKSDQSINMLGKYVTDSTTSFQDVAKRMETNDKENRASIVDLQKRSNRIILSLGIVMIVAASTFSVMHLILG